MYGLPSHSGLIERWFSLTLFLMILSDCVLFLTFTPAPPSSALYPYAGKPPSPPLPRPQQRTSCE